MNKRDIILRRFSELDAEAERMPCRATKEHQVVVDTSSWHQWPTAVMNLLEAVFGPGSPHCRNFQKIYDKCFGLQHGFFNARGVFNAAKSGFEGGYLFSLEQSLSGEVLGDFVSLAKQALDQNQKDVAAVLAAAALEDALKRLALMNGLDV